MAKEIKAKTGYLFPEDKEGRRKEISFDPNENPPEFAEKFSAVMKTNPVGLQDFIQKLEKLGSE